MMTESDSSSNLGVAERNAFAVQAVIGLLLLLIGWVIAVQAPVPRWEKALTRWFNDASDGTARLLWPIMQLGSIWAAVGLAIVTWFVWGFRPAIAVAASGATAWFFAKLLKELVGRGRPLQYLASIEVREGTGRGLGFVSGHTAVAFAIAVVTIPAMSRRLARWLTMVIAALVGIARIVYGVHLPADVIGGAGIGVIVGGAASMVGWRIRSVPADRATGLRT